jgi:pimeloyl-ACP methyl ester carboxylesterase
MVKHSINYEKQGNGTPLLLLHGWGSSLRTWDSLLPHLHAAGYQTYAMDLLGHGDSGRINGSGDYRIESYYRHFLDWLGELNLPQPMKLVGHSTGGYLCLLYAQRNADAVECIALMDPLYTPDQLSNMAKVGIERPGLTARLMRAAPAWLVRSAVRAGSKLGGGMPRLASQQMAADFRRMDPLITQTPGSIEDLSAVLHSIAARTLMIWGKQDKVLSPDSFARLVERLPNAKSFSIHGAGHSPHLTHIDSVAQALVNFLSDSD